MEDKVVVRIELSREEYKRLARLAEQEGYSLVSDYVRGVIADLIAGRLTSGCEQGVDEKRLADAISRRLERRIMDLLNPFTGKIDEVQRRLAELVEAIEASEARAQAPPPQAPMERPSQRQARPMARHGQSRGMERLREEGVVFESDLRGRIRNVDAFLRRLESEGAILVEAAGERAAVDPGFWARLAEELAKLSIRDTGEVEAILDANLGERAARLFRLLVKAGLAVYDEESAQWLVRRPRR